MKRDKSFSVMSRIIAFFSILKFYYNIHAGQNFTNGFSWKHLGENEILLIHLVKYSMNIFGYTMPTISSIKSNKNGSLIVLHFLESFSTFYARRNSITYTWIGEWEKVIRGNDVMENVMCVYISNHSVTLHSTE